MRILAVFLFTVFHFIELNAQWTELNGSTNSVPINYASSDWNGNLYASKTDLTGKNYLAKWDGISWTDVGNTRTNSTYNDFTFVIPDNLGSIYSVFRITPTIGGNQRKVLGQWNGSNWTEIFSLNQNNFENFWSFCCTSSGDFYFNITGISYKNTNTDLDTIYQTIWKWSNNNLSVVYKNINQRLNFTHYMMDFKCNSKGDLFACGDYHNLAGEYFVVKWNGSSWVELSGLNNLKASGQIRNLVIDNKDNIFALGNPLTSSVNYAIAYKWDGGKWIDLNPLQTIFSDPGSKFGNMTLDTIGNLYISALAFLNPTFTVFKWNSGNWLKLTGSNGFSPFNNGSFNTLCLDKNQDLIACGDFINSNNQWYLAKFTNSKFVTLNENSFSNTGGFIYPNPSTNKINFNLGDDAYQKFNLIVINSLGEIVIEKINADTREALDVSILREGIYIIQIQNEVSKQSFKFVKE